MSAKLLDGKVLAARLKEDLKKEVAILKKQAGREPRFINVMVGDDPGAVSYANSQKKISEEIGIAYELTSLPLETTQQKLIEHIERLNRDSNINGIMIYKPVPKHIDYSAVVDRIAADKNLEATHVANIGRVVLGTTKILPCTPAAVMEHLRSTKTDLSGKEAVIVGRSDVVGKPLFFLLLKEAASVTVCHSGTDRAGKLADHVKRADIVVAAVGKAGFVKGEWIKKGAIVIDVGINRVDNKIVGDVEFEAAAKQASFITPVPGGVGPVTVMMLIKNGIEALKMQNSKNP